MTRKARGDVSFGEWVDGQISGLMMDAWEEGGCIDYPSPTRPY